MLRPCACAAPSILDATARLTDIHGQNTSCFLPDFHEAVHRREYETTLEEFEASFVSVTTRTGTVFTNEQQCNGCPAEMPCLESLCKIDTELEIPES